MPIVYWIRLKIPIISCFMSIVYWDYNKIINTAEMNGELVNGLIILNSNYKQPPVSYSVIETVF